MNLNFLNISKIQIIRHFTKQDPAFELKRATYVFLCVDV